MSALTVETYFLVREQLGAQRLASCARPNVPTLYASNDPNASREIDGAMGNSEVMSHRSVDGSAIATENGLFC